MSWRALELDGEVLLFDRKTGTNVLINNDTTRALVRQAPRTLQVALTNACDKTCSFCYRPLAARSRWSFDELVALAQFCDRWGVLELAFGGGEPTLFPRFAELVQTIWRTTALCPNFTTHGKHLDEQFLRAIAGCYGQFQVSVYDEDDTLSIIDLAVRERARFGLNYLITPARAATLEVDVLAFWDRGVRDILLLSYKGPDPTLHLTTRQCRALDDSIARLHQRFGRHLTLKVDVCWAHRLVVAPQLLNADDCGANVDFVSITSDKCVLSCSFSDDGIPFDDPSQIRDIWSAMQGRQIAAQSPGCARLPNFGAPRPALVSLSRRPS